MYIRLVRVHFLNIVFFLILPFLYRLYNEVCYFEIGNLIVYLPSISLFNLQFISFPHTPAQVAEIQEEFFNIAGFPRISGVIDCTHVLLHASNLGPDEHVYVNRKGKHSINVQLICKPDYTISNVVARWPGATHDSRIFQMSRICRAFARRRVSGILLGDSGYPLLPFLMTPISNPTTDAERAYNKLVTFFYIFFLINFNYPYHKYVIDHVGPICTHKRRPTSFPARFKYTWSRNEECNIVSAEYIYLIQYYARHLKK